MKIRVEVNTDELMKAVKAEPIIASQEIQKAVNKSAIKVLQIAQKEAPVKTHHLVQRIKARFEPLVGIVESLAQYSVFVHEGTRPHIILPVRKKALANVKRGLMFGRKVNHPGTSPNRFMLRSIKKAIPSIERYFEQAVENIVKKI